MLKKNFAHDYDPSIVFQSHSSDLPHLNDWITELIALSEKSLPIQSSPTTEQLVQALQRYDAMFRELLRQTSVFSEPLTRLLAKVWGGNLKLLDYMIKSYHRYVKHTTHLQEQAQQLLTERQGQMVAAKVKDEEFEMEKLVLRARIRNLESEVEALKLSDRSKDKEIMRLRTTVTAYMRSEQLSDGLWAMMQASDPVTLTKDGDVPDAIESRFCRKDSIEASVQQMRSLSRLDVAMDEMLGGIIKEEDRQRMLVADMLRLMKRNEAVFGALRKVKGQWQSGVIEATKFEDKGIQADERDVYGAVCDLVRSPRSVPRINPPAAPTDMTIVGGDVPYQLRKLMKTFPRVLRIPPAAWVCQTIMTIYFDKVRIDEGLKSKGLTTATLAVHMHDYFHRCMGCESAADTQIAQLLAAVEHYKDRVPRVALFGSQIGIFNKNEDPPLDVRDTDFLLSIIRLLLKNGEMLVVEHTRPVSQQHHSNHHHGHGHHGHQKLTGQAAAQQAYLQRRNSREALNTPVPSGGQQQQQLQQQQQQQPQHVHGQGAHAHAHAHARTPTTYSIWDHVYSTIGSDISRASACRVVQQVLGRWLPDGGSDYVLKVKAMNATDKLGRMVDIDELMDVLLEPWAMIRINWVEHARYLFKEHCLIHKVLSEAQFADDAGQPERDSILVEVQRVVAVESLRRPMRAFQQRAAITEHSKIGGGAGGAASGAPTMKRAGDKGMTLEKEPVCETMNRKLFASVIAIMDNTIPHDKVDAMFDDACSWAHDNCLHTLSYMWLRCAYERHSDADAKFEDVSDDEEVEDEHGVLRKVRRHHGRYFYVNTKSRRTQWARPYHEHTFHSSEIEVDAFIAIVLKHDILANCPFVELFHVAPPDLWPNAVLFLKQAQDAKVKAKRIADSQAAQQQQQQQMQQQATAALAASLTASLSSKSKHGKHASGKGHQVSRQLSADTSLGRSNKTVASSPGKGESDMEDNGGDGGGAGGGGDHTDSDKEGGGGGGQHSSRGSSRNNSRPNSSSRKQPPQQGSGRLSPTESSSRLNSRPGSGSARKSRQQPQQGRLSAATAGGDESGANSDSETNNNAAATAALNSNSRPSSAGRSRPNSAKGPSSRPVSARGGSASARLTLVAEGDDENASAT